MAVNFLHRRRCDGDKTKAAAPFGTAARYSNYERVLAEVVRHVVERRVQLVADALHRANGRNGDESGDQAVLDGGRTLFVTESASETCSWSSLLGSKCRDGIAALPC